MKYIKLNNNVEMPSIGIGTFLLKPIDAEKSVSIALNNGYRLIDTANFYGNEKAVGRAIRNSGVPREEIFVSSKIWPNEYNNEFSVEETLNRLGLDYLDLLFLHQPTGDILKGYKQLEKAYKEGKIRAIGLSNFEDKFLDKILKEAEIKPQIMQLECNPFFPQDKFRSRLDDLGIVIMSWYPLGGKGHTKELLNNEIIVSLANKYNKAPAQIILRWHIQMGFSVIPGSKNEKHIKDNIDLFDFELSDEDMNEIAKINNGKKRFKFNFLTLLAMRLIKPRYEK